MERFFREACITADFKHPNIIPIFDAGQIAGTAYFALKYIEGKILGLILQVLQQPMPSREELSAYDNKLQSAHGSAENAIVSDNTSPLSVIARRRQAGAPILFSDYLKWVANLGIQAASGLSYAHNQGLIHRDIKPSNLILALIVLADLHYRERARERPLPQGADEASRMSAEASNSAERSGVDKHPTGTSSILVPVTDSTTPDSDRKRELSDARKPSNPRKANSEDQRRRQKPVPISSSAQVADEGSKVRDGASSSAERTSVEAHSAGNASAQAPSSRNTIQNNKSAQTLPTDAQKAAPRRAFRKILSEMPGQPIETSPISPNFTDTGLIAYFRLDGSPYDSSGENSAFSLGNTRSIDNTLYLSDQSCLRTMVVQAGSMVTQTICVFTIDPCLVSKWKNYMNRSDGTYRQSLPEEYQTDSPRMNVRNSI